uniref:Uncharacterized protein n=1 Tax=Myotis myotis TaxID=51298 RepID=A0A7J7VIA2_MYOMY|nr:hypothetical protein mMyoMyo1_008298 [Myotis myotis]
MGSSTGPGRLGGWETVTRPSHLLSPEGHVAKWRKRSPTFTLGWIWSSLRKWLCVQNPSKFGWVLPVTYKYVCPQTEEKQSQRTSSRAEVMSGQLTLKASLDVTSPGSLPCDYVVLCNIPVITHLTT